MHSLTAFVALLFVSCSRSADDPAQHASKNTPRAAETAVELPDKTSSAPFQFRQQSFPSGLTIAYRNGVEAGHSSILESIGGGVGAIDFDCDGLLDLCLPGGGGFSAGPSIHGHPTRLLRNLGNWQFTAIDSQAIGNTASLYTHGVSGGDFDNDGFPDFLITGYGGIQLWKNHGDGTFSEVSGLAGVQHESWCTSAGWGDLTGDGNLDVYVCNYVNWSFQNHPYCKGPEPSQREICPPRAFEPLNDVVFFSKGDGTFYDATAEAGLSPGGKGLGVLLADLDNDSDLDIYVANDTTDNFLYLNDGSGRLEEVAALAGAAVDNQGIPNGSMGVDLCDFNQDGRADLWVTNYEREPFGLYRNEGSGQFLHVSQPTGITALGGKFVGFGTAFVDLDRDGVDEVVVTNGHVIKYPPFAPRRQLPLVLTNTAGQFKPIDFPAGHYLSTPQEGRGLAIGDFDEDGLQDVVVTHLNESPAILANETRSAHGWLRLRLIGLVSNRNAIGARLTLHTTAGKYMRQVKGGSSYLSQHDYRIFWGIRQGTEVEKITIHWPSGMDQELTSLTLNREHIIAEGVNQAL